MTTTVQKPKPRQVSVDDEAYPLVLLSPLTVRCMLDQVLSCFVRVDEVKDREIVSGMLGVDLLRAEVTNDSRLILSTAVREVRTKLEATIALETGLGSGEVYEALRDPESAQAQLLSAETKMQLEVLRALNVALHY